MKYIHILHFNTLKPVNYDWDQGFDSESWFTGKNKMTIAKICKHIKGTVINQIIIGGDKSSYNTESFTGALEKSVNMICELMVDSKELKYKKIGEELVIFYK